MGESLDGLGEFGGLHAGDTDVIPDQGGGYRVCESFFLRHYYDWRMSSIRRDADGIGREAGLGVSGSDTSRAKDPGQELR